MADADLKVRIGAELTDVEAGFARLRRDLDDLDRKAAETRGVERFNERLTSLAELVGTAARALVLTLGPAFAALGVAAIKAEGQLDQAFDTLRIQTGATGDALRDLEHVTTTVFRALPVSIQDTARVIADLHTRFGLTGEGAERLGTQVLNLTRLLGVQAPTAVSQFTRVLGDWSIRIDDAGTALDFLFKVTQTTGIGIDRLMTLVVQFGAPLRQLGFGFEEAAALLGKFEKEGVNVETVMAGLKIAVARFSEAGLDAATGLRLAIDEIKNAGSAAEANRVAVEIFGQRAGPDMAAAIREGRFEIQGFVADLRASPETIHSAARATDDWRESLTTFWNRLTVAAATLGQQFIPTIERLVPVLDRVVTAVEGAVDWFTRLPEPVKSLAIHLGAFVALLGSVLAGTSALTATLGRWFPVIATAGTWLLRLTGWLGLVVTAGSFLLSNWSDVTSVASRVWPTVANAVLDAVTAILVAFKNLLAVKVLDWFLSTAQSVGEWLGLLHEADTATGVIAGTIDRLIGTLQGYKVSTDDSAASTAGLSTEAGAAAESAQGHAAALGEQTGALSRQQGAITGYSGSVLDLIEGLKRWREEQQQAKEATEQTHTALAAVAQRFRDFGDATEQTRGQLQAYEAEYDTLIQLKDASAARIAFLRDRILELRLALEGSGVIMAQVGLALAEVTAKSVAWARVVGERADEEQRLLERLQRLDAELSIHQQGLDRLIEARQRLLEKQAAGRELTTAEAAELAALTTRIDEETRKIFELESAKRLLEQTELRALQVQRSLNEELQRIDATANVLGPSYGRLRAQLEATEQAMIEMEQAVGRTDPRYLALKEKADALRGSFALLWEDIRVRGIEAFRQLGDAATRLGADVLDDLFHGKTPKWSDAWTRFKDDVIRSMAEMASEILIKKVLIEGVLGALFSGQGLSGFTGAFQGFVSTIAGLFGGGSAGGGAGLVGNIAQGTGAIQGSLGTMVSSFAASVAPIALSLGAIALAVFVFKDEIIAFWQMIFDAYQTVWTAIFAFTKTIWSGILSFYREVFDQLRSIATQAWETITRIFREAFEAIRSALAAFADVLKSAWSSLFSTLASIASQGWSIVKGIFSSAFDFIKSAASSAFSFVQSGLSGMLSAARSAASTVGGLIASAAGRVANFVSSAASTIAGVFDGGASGRANQRWDQVIHIYEGRGIRGNNNEFKSAAIDAGLATSGGPFSPVLTQIAQTATSWADLIAKVRAGHAAHGALVRGPAFLQVGEGGHDEAVVPLGGAAGRAALRALGAGALEALRDLALPAGLTPPRAPGLAVAGGGFVQSIEISLDGEPITAVVVRRLERHLKLRTGRG